MSSNVDFNVDGWLSARSSSAGEARVRKLHKQSSSFAKKMSLENSRKKHGRKKIHKKSKMKSRYGVSEEWYKEQLLEQNGVCYICKRPPLKRSLSIDHNHCTGEVRKLLCGGCNMALGMLREDIGIMYSMIDYVVDHNGS